MDGLEFAGIVTQETAKGSVKALRFRANVNTLSDMRLAITHEGVTQITHGAGEDPSVLSGHVVMDVTYFKAKIDGVPVEFTPDNPPPAELIRPDMTFTDVESRIVLVTCDKMTIDGMVQSRSTPPDAAR
jgi:hypothetical protein